MGKRKAEEEKKNGSSKVPEKKLKLADDRPADSTCKKRNGSLYTAEQRAGAPEWIAELMVLAEVDSNKSGGAAEYRSRKDAVLQKAPECWHRSIRNMKFKANTKSVHAKECDTIIQAALKGVPPPEGTLPPPEPPAVVSAAKNVKRSISKSQDQTSAASGKKATKRPQTLEHFFGTATLSLPSAREKAAEDEQRGGSAPPARGPKILGGKCPYEILRIAHDVSFSQLRHAYKQRALETHPDKGGSDEMFKEVNTAFEFLSKKSNKPCDVAQEEQPAQTTDVAKSFLAQLLLKHLPFEAVKVIDRHVVENLREHLEELLKQGATNTKSGEKGNLAETNGSGLSRNPCGTYKVDLSWKCFRARVDHIPDVQVAMTINCAMVTMRKRAVDRIDKVSEKRKGSAGSVTEEEPPLIEAELMALWAEQPCAVLFASDLRKKWLEDNEEDPQEQEEEPKQGKSDRWMSSWTSDLQRALQFRRQLRQQLGLTKGLSARKDEKKTHSDTATQDKQDFRKLQEDLLRYIQNDLERRNAAPVPAVPALQAVPAEAKRMFDAIQERLILEVACKTKLKEKNDRKEIQLKNQAWMLKNQEDQINLLKDDKQELESLNQDLSTRNRNLLEEKKRGFELEDKISASRQRSCIELRDKRIARQMASSTVSRTT